jgi:AcrR family transcriptional regulator
MKDTKELLMKSAAELICEVGFENMTTSAVARRAKVSEGTIYRYFASKEALAEAVFADVWRQFNEYMEAHLPPREKPIERLEAFWPLTLKAHDELMPGCGVLTQQEHLYFAGKHSKTINLPPGCREYVGLLEESISISQKVGRVRPDVDPAIAALFLFFGAGDIMEFYSGLHNAEQGYQPMPASVAEQLFRLMRRALYGDIE